MRDGTDDVDKIVDLVKERSIIQSNIGGDHDDDFLFINDVNTGKGQIR